ncbi:prolipoprotein diacylglyceryl transferase [Anaerocolumna aminovalerica]|uniref:prolipoprotein diacylglyceryl transferase n=1 Tax=Anaerocolumna aminovalerica TaxID=1527 RepID=UPI000BE3F9BC|nr:prolipoprotein diacylglyceryl transferase [Anaerocolumna aminovalerica]
MLPTIVVLGREISLYGLMGVIGIFFGVLAAIYRRKIYHINKEDVIFSSCYAGIGLLLGAKLLFIITIIPDLIKNRDLLIANPKLLLHILFGGLVFYGGLIGAFLGFYIYSRQYKINFITLLDLIAPSIPLIHGFGRIGCFTAGCCYGIEYDGIFHVIFERSQAAPNGVALLPVQLISSGINFLGCITLFIYARKKRKSGRVIGIYLIFYSIARFMIEFFRGDVARGIFFGVSTSQWISLLLIPIGFWFYTKKFSTVEEETMN